MANIKSAEKRHRQSVKRRERNLHWRSTVKSTVKKAREALASKDPQAKAAVQAAERILRKAATKGIIHRRNADRHVARLAKAAAALTKAAAPAAKPNG